MSTEKDKKEEKKNENPFGAFDALKLDTKGSPFGDNLEMVFTDETNQTSVKVDEKVDNKTDEAKIAADKLAKEKADADKLEADALAKKEAEEKAAADELKNKKKPKVDDKGNVIEEETEEQEEDEVSPLHAFYSFLNDEGLVVPVEEGKTVESESDLKGVIQNTINTGIENYKSSKPEDVQKFIEFVDNGGDPRMFHKLYYEQRSWKDVDPTKEANQELVIREAFALAGWDEEDINAEIQDKKDLGKLGPLAEKLHKKLVAGEDEDKKSLLEAQKEYKKRQEEVANKQWDEFKDNLYKKEELNGFKLTKKQKDDLWEFITKPDKKSGKTQLQNHNETNTDAQFLYAWMALNNWDMSKLEKQVKTKVTSELASKLKNITDSRSKVSKGASDSFKDKKDGKNPFSAFKQALDNNLI